MDGTKLDKWNSATKKAERLFTIYNSAPVSSNNTTKANPALSADILGDWREEMLFRTDDNTRLILFTTDIPTEHRIYTLMHDPQYRTAIAWQNSAYNQPPHPSFFLGNGMATPPVPNIYLSEPDPIVDITPFKLPASNFQIAITGEACKASGKGKISITAAQNLNYSATVVKAGVSTSYYFTKTLDIPNLAAGTYSLCITIEGQSAYKQCYDNLVVTEPKDLSVYSSINESNNTISLSMAGGKSYHINLNGVQYSTSQTTITLPLNAGANTLNVTTDSQCQGEIEKIVTLYDKVIVYPNPFDNTLSLKLGTEPSAKAAIEIRTMGGKLAYAKQFVNTDNNLQLELSHLESGVYLLKLSLDKSETFYKILKK